MKNINIDINMVVIGAGSIGSNFIKEFGRYMAFNNEENCKTKLSIIDKDVLSDDDLYTHPILKQDIGWSKASVIANVIIDTFPQLEEKVFSYGFELTESEELRIIQERHSIKRYSTRYDIYKTIEYMIDTVGNQKTVSTCKQRFKELNNVVWITVNHKTTFGNIDVNIKANGKKIGDRLVTKPIQTIKQQMPISTKFLSALTCSNLLFSMVSNGLGNKKFQVGRINYDVMSYYAIADTKKLNKPLCNNIIHEDSAHNVVVCIGTGGTGGAFAKEFSKILLEKDIQCNTSLILVDGDRVEKRNGERQPFSGEDLMQNKAITLAAAIKECYGVGEEVISVYPHYIDTIEQLVGAISLGLNVEKRNKLYLIGAVDNHRARQIMHQYFEIVDDIIYIDSANEYSHGEVVISVKEVGNVISPLRSFYFPDLLKDSSPSASELSCGVVNISAPQHYSTNLIAGRIVLTALIKAMKYGIQDAGIVYFSSFHYYSRFQPIINGVNV